MIQYLTTGLLLPCYLCPNVFSSFLTTLHGSYNTRWNPLSVVLGRVVFCHRMCVTVRSQHKLWVLTDYPFPDPLSTSLFWRSGLLFLLGSSYYFRLYILNLSCLSMKCVHEPWVIIIVSFWRVYLSLVVKSATHSIAWVKKFKLWITRELNCNLYVKQR